MTGSAEERKTKDRKREGDEKEQSVGRTWRETKREKGIKKKSVLAGTLVEEQALAQFAIKGLVKHG